MKKSRHILFVVSKPEVFKSPTSNTYIIFGEAKVEDLKAKDAAMAAEAQKQQGRRNVQGAPSRTVPTPSLAPSAAAAANDEPVDETGVDPKDIELVISQAACSRSAAVKALKNNENDIVNAIMELTM